MSSQFFKYQQTTCRTVPKSIYKMFSNFDQFQIANTTVNLLDGQLLEINISVFRLMDGHFLHKDPGFRVNHFYMDIGRVGTIVFFFMFGDTVYIKLLYVTVNK